LTISNYVCTFNAVKVTFDRAKRLATLRERGIDFATDEKVFAGDTATMVDKRSDYGEVREITVGWLNGRTAIMVWTRRGEARHIISMRYCHAEEAEKFRRFVQP
jgi:uncharacterized DUF497 family protein